MVCKEIFFFQSTGAAWLTVRLVFTMTQGQFYRTIVWPPHPHKEGFAVAEVRECVENGKGYIYILFQNLQQARSHSEVIKYIHQVPLQHLN
jgi:hypothetical protein